MEYMKSLFYILGITVVVIAPILYIGVAISVFVDSIRKQKRENAKRKVPFFVLLFFYLLFGWVVFPLDWILKKPRSVIKSIIVIVFIWFIPIIIGVAAYFHNVNENKADISNYYLVDEGMTKKQVLKLLGKPNEISNVPGYGKGSWDIWRYESGDSTISVLFNRGYSVK